MRFIWKGNWNKGEITIETETLEEIRQAIEQLSSLGEIKEDKKVTVVKQVPTPTLHDGMGISNAIRALLQSEWGREPRTMNEIKDALETNALYFTKGTLSGTLTMMTKRGNIRRIKRSGRWAYILR